MTEVKIICLKRVLKSLRSVSTSWRISAALLIRGNENGGKFLKNCTKILISALKIKISPATRVQHLPHKRHIFVCIKNPQKRINFALKNHQIKNYPKNKIKTSLKPLQNLFPTNSRINQIKNIHDVVILEYFNVANEENALQQTQKSVFKRFLGHQVVTIRTRQLQRLHQQTIKEPPTNHHKNKHQKALVDEIKIL